MTNVEKRLIIWRMGLYLRNLFWLLLISLILFVIVAFTLPGNKLLIYAGNHLVPNLTMRLEGNPLLRGGLFSLDYQSEHFNLVLEDVSLDVQF